MAYKLNPITGQFDLVNPQYNLISSDDTIQITKNPLTKTFDLSTLALMIVIECGNASTEYTTTDLIDCGGAS